MRLLRFLLILGLLAGLGVGVVYQFKPEWLIEARYAGERLRAGASEQHIGVDDHDWAYLDAGSGPPLLLVHGFSGSKENWLPLMPYLVERYHVIAVDLPGWGASSRLDDGDYGIPAQVERLAAFIAALKLERPIVVGHSMGGHIAGVLATRHAELVSRLLLVDAAGVPFSSNDFAQRVLSGETPFNVDDRASWARLLGELFVQPPWLPPRVVDVLVSRNIANHAFHDRTIRAIAQGDAAFLLQRELPLLKAPLTVVWCERDRILDVTSVEAFRTVPKVRIELLSGCSHMPMMEVPRELAGAMRL